MMYAVFKMLVVREGEMYAPDLFRTGINVRENDGQVWSYGESLKLTHMHVLSSSVDRYVVFHARARNGTVYRNTKGNRNRWKPQTPGKGLLYQDPRKPTKMYVSPV